jgi:4-aminobutyrate aminotransferase-like enzyme
MQATHPVIADVRGDGLFIGVELVDPDGVPMKELTGRVVNAMRERRVLISATGINGNVLKIRPPLILERAHADLLLATTDEALTSVGA